LPAAAFGTSDVSLAKSGVIWNLTKADKSAKMIIGKTLTNYHYGNIGTTGFGTIFSSGHI
jgi:hypothetical protein